MAGLELKYKLDMSKIEGGFKRLSGINTKPLMEAIGTHQLSETQRNFKRGQSPDGDRWVDSQGSLDRALSGSKERSGKTLIDSGLLLKSYTYNAGRNNVEIGSNRAYAAIHHFGFKGSEVVKSHNRLISQAFGKRLRGPTWQTVNGFSRTMNMPARPALGVTSADEQTYDDLVQKFVSKNLSEGFR